MNTSRLNRLIKSRDKSGTEEFEGKNGIDAGFFVSGQRDSLPFITRLMPSEIRNTYCGGTGTSIRSFCIIAASSRKVEFESSEVGRRKRNFVARLFG